VGIACIFWFIVNNQDVLRQKFEVPVEYMNLAQNYVISGEKQETVDVWVRGTARLLKRITPGFNMVAVVDLSNVLKGPKEFRITEEEITRPSQNLEIFKIDPAMIAVSIEEVKSRVVKIYPDFEGTVKEGYEFKYQISPSQIEVQGPESIVNRTFTAITDPILLEGQSKSLTKEVNIKIDPQLKSLSASTALVSIKIAETEVEAALSGVPLNVLPGKFQFQINAETVAVTIFGPRSVVSNLSAEEMQAELSLEGLVPSADFYEVEPRLILPDKIKCREINPSIIRVKILNREIETQSS